MKVYLSVDMEGVCGVGSRDEVTKGTEDFGPAQSQMTDEVMAACEGAYDAGASEIVVKDSHWTGRNLDFRRLTQPQGKKLRLIRGWSGHPFSMVQGLDQSYSAAAFVGYHAAASVAGNPLSHTLSSRLIAALRFNDQLAPEFLVFSYAASLVKVPICFVSGDRAVCEFARRLNETIVTVATIEGEGNSIISLPASEAVRQIRSGMQEAVRSSRGRVLPLPPDFHVRVTFRDHAEAYRRAFYPGARLENDFDVIFETKDYFEVLRLLKFMTLS